MTEEHWTYIRLVNTGCQLVIAVSVAMLATRRNGK